MLANSQKKLLKFLADQKTSNIEIDPHHPRIRATLNPLQYANLFLYYEKLGVKSVATYLDLSLSLIHI